MTDSSPKWTLSPQRTHRTGNLSINKSSKSETRNCEGRMCRLPHEEHLTKSPSLDNFSVPASYTPARGLAETICVVIRFGIIPEDQTL